MRLKNLFSCFARPLPNHKRAIYSRLSVCAERLAYIRAGLLDKEALTRDDLVAVAEDLDRVDRKLNALSIDVLAMPDPLLDPLAVPFRVW